MTIGLTVPSVIEARARQPVRARAVAEGGTSSVEAISRGSAANRATTAPEVARFETGVEG